MTLDLPLRRQLPAYSPVTAGALGAGVVALLSGGRRAREALAAALRRDFGATNVLLTDSGTSALALAIAAAVAGPASGMDRRIVALPAYGCYDLATACLAADVDAWLYDLDPATLGPDPASLEAALAAGVRAVVVAHLYGIPADLDAAATLAGRAGARLIDDAAQGAGAAWHDRPLGGHGAFGVLSFGRGKGVTGGGGGALVLMGPAQAAAPAGGGRGAGGWLKLATQWALGRPALYGVPASVPGLRLGQAVFRAPHPPRGIAASAAGVLARTRRLVEVEAATRRARASALRAAVGPRGLVPRLAPPARAGWLRLPLLVPRPAGEVVTRRTRRLGIERAYPLALADLPGFAARVRNRADALPGARELARRLVTVPTHSRLTPGDVRALERWIAEATA